MKIEVKNLRNETVGERELPDTVFDYPFKAHLIHTAVEAYRAGLRAGTHKTKTRADVSATSRKPWRQKGTGRARSGRSSSPLWRSGGTVHGPQPRDHSKKLSVREKRNALKSALSRKVADAQLVILDSFELESHKTSALTGHLRGLGIEGKALLVDNFDNANLLLAARNNPRLKSVDALAVNVYDVIDRPVLVVSEKALDRLVEVLSK